MKHVVFIAIFFVAFITARAYVIYHHQRNCGCDKYDKYVFFSIPNGVAFLIAFIIAAVVQLLVYP